MGILSKLGLLIALTSVVSGRENDQRVLQSANFNETDETQQLNRPADGTKEPDSKAVLQKGKMVSFATRKLLSKLGAGNQGVIKIQKHEGFTFPEVKNYDRGYKPSPYLNDFHAPKGKLKIGLYMMQAGLYRTKIRGGESKKDAYTFEDFVAGWDPVMTDFGPTNPDNAGDAREIHANTYVISNPEHKANIEFRFGYAQTGFGDRLSKHTVLNGFYPSLYSAGEMFVGTLEGKIILIMDNNSGTFKPKGTPANRAHIQAMMLKGFFMEESDPKEGPVYVCNAVDVIQKKETTAEDDVACPPKVYHAFARVVRIH
mmetsp:Transcript_29896/g.52492  ORF Transcript_29896/g.52492 Transcript_29896/m.52492 type:complete len:314 (-) Transcript_29896:427-1368(-)